MHQVSEKDGVRIRVYLGFDGERASMRACQNLAYSSCCVVGAFATSPLCCKSVRDGCLARAPTWIEFRRWIVGLSGNVTVASAVTGAWAGAGAEAAGSGDGGSAGVS